MKILITGASGSGTTTLGRFIESHHGYRSVDTDEYYWLESDPPYRLKRAEDERLLRILSDLQGESDYVVSGSIMGWGEQLEDCFDLIVFLFLETAVRVERLRARELQEFGVLDEKFIDWAASYDDGPAYGRSLARHEKWLAERSCSIIRIEGDHTVESRARLVMLQVSSLGAA